MHVRKVSAIKGEAPVKLVALFLGKIERREVPERDILGIETLGFLIEALRVVGTKTQTWGVVAKYVLKKANDKFRFSSYTETLRAIAPHVSMEVAERIAAHLATYGEANAVLEITTNKLQRKPSADEVLAMGEYHRNKWTSSNAEVWGQILSLAHKNDISTINNMIAEVKKHEDEPDLY